MNANHLRHRFGGEAGREGGDRLARRDRSRGPVSPRAGRHQPIRSGSLDRTWASRLLAAAADRLRADFEKGDNLVDYERSANICLWRECHSLRGGRQGVGIGEPALRLQIHRMRKRYAKHIEARSQTVSEPASSRPSWRICWRWWPVKRAAASAADHAVGKAGAIPRPCAPAGHPLKSEGAELAKPRQPCQSGFSETRSPDRDKLLEIGTIRDFGESASVRSGQSLRVRVRSFAFTARRDSRVPVRRLQPSRRRIPRRGLSARAARMGIVHRA